MIVARPAIALITRGQATPENFEDTSRQILDIVKLAVEHGIAFVQIREKRLTAKLVYDIASRVAEVTRSSGTKLLVNDRADIALAAGADGVHLTAKSMPVRTVREFTPEGFIIGVSVHTREAAAVAKADGADFAVFGPVFETLGKPNAQGSDELRAVCESVGPFPVLAIGGVDEANAEQVIDAGASGIAAIRALNDPESLLRIIEILNGPK